jgi:hypothetical protein
MIIWYLWPSRIHKSDWSNRKFSKANGHYGTFDDQSLRRGLKDFETKWRFSHRTDVPGDQASLEICLIDAKTEDAIRVGSVSVSKEPMSAAIFTDQVDQNGAIGLSLDPGPYSIKYQVPGYICPITYLEISSPRDHVRKIVKLQRKRTINGIVLNASRQPQPDASILFGVPITSSIVPIPTVHTGDSGDLMSPSMNTDNSGKFTAELGSSYEETMIYASKTPYGIAKIGPINIDESAGKLLEIVFSKGEEKCATISGKIVDSEMNPVSDAIVEFVYSPIMPTINPALRNLDAENLHKLIRTDPAKVFIKQSEPKYSDPIDQFLSNLYFHPKTISNEAGYFSLQIQVPNKGILKTSAEGFLPYQEPSFDIQTNTTTNIYLKTPQMFSVRITDASNANIMGLTVKAIDMPVYGPDSQSNKYFSTVYPVTLFAEGLRSNQGMTERKHIARYQREIELKLGSCDIQGHVVDENGLPIKNIYVSVNTVGETEKEIGLKINQSAIAYYSDSGNFSLRHLIPGKASLTISGSANEQTLFEKKTISLLLLEDTTANPTITLKRK